MTSLLTQALNEVPLALKGENNPNVKLTWEKAEDIRNSSLSSKELSNEYNISRNHINRIRRGKQWKNRPSKKDISIRFWNKVDKSGDCWNWTGKKNGHGYGRISYKFNKTQKSFLAHRVSYEMHFGPIPEGLLVLHKCDNKLCVNPTHLELGNQSKNIQDAWDRGLRRRKEKIK